MDLNDKKLDLNKLPKQVDKTFARTVEQLVESVDFLHAKYDFFEKFLLIKNDCIKQYDELLHKNDSVLKSILRKLFYKKPSCKSVIKDTIQKVNGVIYLEELVAITKEKIIKKQAAKKRRGMFTFKTLNNILNLFYDNLIQPAADVINLQFLRNLQLNLKSKFVTGQRSLKGAGNFVFSGLKTALIFSVIFIFTFTFINLEAIYTISSHYIKTDSLISGYFLEIEARDQYVEEESLVKASEDLILAEEDRVLVKDSIFPPLNIEVTPDDNRIEIPRISKNIPIENVKSEDVIYTENLQEIEDSIQDALQDGVVRYPGTAVPGEKGNVFLTGHSSYYLWSPGKYKDVFALLHELQLEDEIIIFYDQQKYKYKVSEIKEVWPNEVDILKQTDDYRLTLMTCTPIGTNLKRLVVVAKQVE